MSTEEWRFIVLSKTGNGKSTSINTIVGKNVCPAECSSQSVTKKCQMVEEIAHGKRLIIVDTPGLFDTDEPENETIKEIGKITAMTAPGFHAFIVVFQIGRFTDEEIRSVEILTKLFGFELYERTVVLFTGVDNLEAEGIEFEKYVDSIKSVELCQFIKRCGKRVVGFNNRNISNKRQVECLLRSIGKVVEAKENTFYTDAMYQEAARIITEEQLRRHKAGNTNSDVEIRRKIRRDVAEENGEGARLLSVLSDKIALPILEKLAEQVVKKAGVVIAQRCTIS